MLLVLHADGADHDAEYAVLAEWLARQPWRGHLPLATHLARRTWALKPVARDALLLENALDAIASRLGPGGSQQACDLCLALSSADGSICEAELAVINGLLRRLPH